MLPNDWKKQLMAVYPKRNGQGWIKAEEKIRGHLAKGESFDEMLKGANNYRKHCAVTGEFVRMAQTFFGPNMWWLEFLDDEPLTNEITLDDEAGELGITRQEGESDESLKRRIGIAQTMKAYNMQ